MSDNHKRKPFDPSAIVEQAITAEFNTTIFNEIDDSAIDKAPNWLEWCLGKNFLNAAKVLPRQVQICTVFFGEYCPRCSTKDYIHDLFKQDMSDIRENVTFLEYGVCPKCKITQRELFLSKELGEYNELDCVIGRRGGKSAAASLISSYQLHRFLVMPNPAKLYGTMDKDTLTFAFLAVTMKQAKETLWDKFTARIDSSPWFAQYHKLLADIAKRKGIKVTDIFKYDTGTLEYYHKAIVCKCFTPDINTLRGSTVIFYGIDELGYFDNDANSKKVKANAHETYGSMNTSCQTIRQAASRLRHTENFIPTAVGMNISSPFTADDMIMTLYKQRHDRSNVLGYLYPTWLANPEFTREKLWEETQDKRKFFRDYECIPSIGGDSVFLGETSLVNRCVGDKENLFFYNFHTQVDKVNSTTLMDKDPETVYAKIQVSKPERAIPRILGVDVGRTDNSFALILASYNPQTGAIEVDGALECPPLIKPNGTISPVNTALMFEHAIVPILENFNVIYVVYDSWNSLDAISTIRTKYHINSEEYSLTYRDFVNIVRPTVYEGKLKIPKPEVELDQLLRHKFEDVITMTTPVSNLLYQMSAVQESGNRIVKPYKGTDDLFRAMALCIRFIKQPELIGRFSVIRGQSGGDGKKLLGNVRLYSSGDPRDHGSNGMSSRIGQVVSISGGRRRI